MKFSYNTYLRAGLYVPAASLIFVLGLVTVCVVVYLKKGDYRFGQFVKGIAIPCVGFLMLLIHDIPTLKYTVNEKPAEAIQIAGTIDSIKEVASSPRYYLSDDDNHIVRASIVSIDGIKYYFMTAETLEVGDRIDVCFMPQSRVVLSWDYSPPTQSYGRYDESP